MPALRLPEDRAFFAEHRLRAEGLGRCLVRARRAAELLGVDRGTGAPVLVSVVGSKGKGTIAAFASAYLRRLGLRVGTVTSPGLVTNRERVRVDGRAIGAAEYRRLAALVAETAARVERRPGEGYLSPSGLYVLAGVRHFQESGCDAWVVEAGMGGRSDELSLLAPAVVAVGAIFDEHRAELGGSLEAIAADKLGVIAASTCAVVSREQRPVVDRLLRAAAGDRPLHRPPPVAGLPPPQAANAAVGLRAGEALAALRGLAPLPAAELGALAREVRLPGRLSLHRRGDATWLVDAAIDGTGAGAALDWCRRTLGPPALVLAGIPDRKDWRGVAAALDRVPHTFVTVPDEGKLTFAATTARGAVPVADLDLDALGPTVLALGTVSVVGELLYRLGASTDTWW